MCHAMWLNLTVYCLKSTTFNGCEIFGVFNESGETFLLFGDLTENFLSLMTQVKIHSQLGDENAI